MSRKRTAGQSARSRNHERAQRARMALNDYVCEQKASGSPRYDEEPLQTILVDFLTDLMHYCRSKSDASLDAALDMARIHFQEETAESGRAGRRTRT